LLVRFHFNYYPIIRNEIIFLFLFLAKSIIDPKASDTAAAFLFFDKLFDSLNGSFDKQVDGKLYRVSVKQNFIHHKLWQDSLKILSTMQFV
jgi:hypothetical protein